MHPLVGNQQLPAASPVANEEFSIDQLVPVTSSRPRSRLTRPSRAAGGKVPNPHGSVHQDHQATLRLVTAVPGAWERRVRQAPYRPEPKALIRRVAYQGFKAQTHGRVSVVAPQATLAS